MRRHNKLGRFTATPIARGRAAEDASPDGSALEDLAPRTIHAIQLSSDAPTLRVPKVDVDATTTRPQLPVRKAPPDQLGAWQAFTARDRSPNTPHDSNPDDDSATSPASPARGKHGTSPLILRLFVVTLGFINVVVAVGFVFAELQPTWIRALRHTVVIAKPTKTTSRTVIVQANRYVVPLRSYRVRVDSTSPCWVTATRPQSHVEIFAATLQHPVDQPIALSGSTDIRIEAHADALVISGTNGTIVTVANPIVGTVYHIVSEPASPSSASQSG